VKLLRDAVALAFLPALLVSCSSPAPAPKNKAVEAPTVGTSTFTGTNPMGKDIELSGFRISEGSDGKLKVRMVAINHGDADMGDVILKVGLSTTAAKPGDPPIAEFTVKVPSFGPQDVKDVSAEAVTKLHRFEFPDWQFLRAVFDVTAP
jgi:hypothetical protein